MSIRISWLVDPQNYVPFRLCWLHVVLINVVLLFIVHVMLFATTGPNASRLQPAQCTRQQTRGIGNSFGFICSSLVFVIH